MPKVSQQHRDAQRRRIHDAALEAYARKGFAHTTMADIIEGSGLSAGAIYGYYSGKAEIRRAVAAEILQARGDTLREAAEQQPPAPPGTVLGELVRSLPEALVGSGVLLQLWGETGSPDVAELASTAIATLEDAVTDYLRAWFAGTGMPRRTADRRARRLAPAVLGLTQGYIVQRSLLGPERGEVYLASMEALLSAASSLIQ